MRALQAKARKALLCLLRMAVAGSEQGLSTVRNHVLQALSVLLGSSGWPVPARSLQRWEPVAS
jgi:hypothetical protein